MKTPQVPAMPGMAPLGVRRPATGEHSIGLGVANSLDQDRAELARRKAAAPLKPKAPQSACALGLFSDAAAQTDLVDMARAKR